MSGISSKQTGQGWVAGFEDAGKRLDVFLADKTRRSRAQIKKQAESGGFTVNSKPCSAHHFLKEGDIIQLNLTIDSPQPTDIKHQALSTKHPAPPLAIVKETKDWLVLAKPAGIIMHPTQEEEGVDYSAAEPTLIDAVIAHAPQVAKVGEDPARPGIMSRLDKDVSGLVVIAKTQSAFEHLKKQFAEHTVTKEYVALVHGDVPTDEGDIKFRIARSTSHARMAARPATGGNDTKSQAAWTHFSVEQRFTGATLLRLQILTGRTHQIRAHLHAFGHPVIGDPLYKRKQTKRNITAPRTMLQSVKLAFDDPATGERVTFERPLDEVFGEMIKQFQTRPHH